MTHSVTIIGAGPAGLACALWLTNHGHRPIVLERASQLGGMLRFNHHNNDGLLGFSGMTGRSIGNRFLEHIHDRNVNIISSALLTSITHINEGFVINFTDSVQHNRINTDYLVVASGTRPRAPVSLIGLASQFPENFFIGAGELRVDSFTAGQRVAMLGGGDNAFENAYHLAQHGVKVDIYCRAEPRARREWRVHCKEAPNIAIYPHTDTNQFTMTSGKVFFMANNEPRQADAIAVMYGYDPNTDVLRNIAPWINTAMNGDGFIKVDIFQRTCIEHLYAIGDVTDRPLPCLPTAIGQGSAAAKAIVLDAEGMLP